MRRPAVTQLLHRLRRARAAGTLAALLLVTVTGAQFGAAWHEMTVRHVICADHGELTDVPLGPRPDALRTHARATEPSGGARAQDPAAPDRHEHCGLALIIQGSPQAPARQASASALPPPPAAAPRAPLMAIGSGRAVVLAGAPKTSPPRV